MSDRIPAAVLLGAIHHTLRTGGDITGAQVAFDLLCKMLGYDPGKLTYTRGWARDHIGTPDHH